MLFLGAMALSMTFAARATSLYNNLNPASSGLDSVFGTLADSFSTGSSAVTLNSVTLDLWDADSNDGGGSVTVDLLTDNSDAPGTVLDTIATISDSSLSATLAHYALDTDLDLAANTRYWIELSSSAGVESTAYWSYSLDATGPGVPGEYFANSNGVFPNVDGPYQMDVEAGVAAATPEPWSLLLLGSGLAILLVPMRRQRAGRV